MKYELKFKTCDISGILQPCIFLFLFLLAGAFQAFAQDPFYLAHQNHTDKVLQVSNSSLSNGTPIVLGVRNDGNVTLRSQQSWYYDNATQTIRLKANSNKCIARKGQQTLGDPIVLADVVAGSDLQKWVVEGNRIKLVANKLLGIGIRSQVFNVNTPVTLEELTTMTAAYECWYMRQVPSQGLTADGNLHRINSPGETFVDMYIPDPCPYQYLDIQARGGDGAYAPSPTTPSKLRAVVAPRWVECSKSAPAPGS
ncbi:MAG: ricin-type beta-trefoil lectin domain protein [Lewinellaceae bacterium]|nr:ricin-type beta-trefoil lectin domain protein [Lewinellaceae bacterium]